jgi:benzylsuccinate CoA-transferase BbsF subunit
MASSEPSSVLLDGVRVLSLGAFVAGNVCPLLLAELGADVVKVEDRSHPEALRAYDNPDQPRPVEPSGVRTTVLFAGLARSVRSAAIDLANDGGRETFRQLAGRADVVVENLSPGSMEAWGCSFSDLRALNPRLVMLSMSGYGRSGPRAHFRAYASNIANHLGLAAAWAPDGTHFDFVAAVHGASAVVAALAAVDGGAPGVSIDLAQTETGAAIMAPLYLDALAHGREWTAVPNEVPGSLLSGVFRCDGADAWVAIDLEAADDWNATCTVVGCEDLALDPERVDPERVDSERVDRQRDAALRGAIGAWAESLTPLQAASRLQRAGVAAAPVQNSEDLWRDPQLRSRGAFAEIDHPDIGVVEYPNTPCRLSRTPGRVVGRAPRLGEHTRAVLGEWLGLTDGDALDELARSGAVWQPDER